MKANFINGAFVDGPRARPNINPSDLSDLVGEYAQADRAQTHAAIAAARAAFAAWAGGNLQLRADLLERIGAEILARKDELGRLLSREEGKTLAEGVGEVARAGAIFRFFGAEVLRLRGDRLASVRSGVDVEVTREPVGVVGVITPWNFPIAIPAWKIAPALAFGNTVVFKPADLVPGSAWALAEIISRSGLPAGVLNLVMGRGREVGAGADRTSRRQRPHVHRIGATGQQRAGGRHGPAGAHATGNGRQEPAGRARRRRPGGRRQLRRARCLLLHRPALHGLVAADRHKAIHARFVQELQRPLEALRVGDALAPDTHIGPVVDQANSTRTSRTSRWGAPRARCWPVAGRAGARTRAFPRAGAVHRC